MAGPLIVEAHAKRVEAHVAKCVICQDALAGRSTSGYCTIGAHLIRLRDHHAAIAQRYGDRQATLALGGDES